MMQAVHDFLKKHSQIIANLPGFTELLAEFVNNIERLIFLSEQQAESSQGVSGSKNDLFEIVATMGYNISKKVEAFAKMTNNKVLASEVHFSESDLFYVADSKLRDRALVIYTKASYNDAALEAYKVTKSELAEFKSKIDLFVAAIPSTRIERTEKKAITSEIAERMAANSTILSKFDILMELVRVERPDIYQSYKDNRKIIDTASGSLALSAFITDSGSGKGIKGAMATFVPQSGTAKAATGKSEKPLVKKTAEKGIFKVKNLPDGIYTVLIEKTGYKSVTVTVNIASGEMTILKVSLEPNA